MSGRRFYEAASADARRSAPAALRNREPIADVLSSWLPSKGTVLEIASGTGEHAAWFARRFPNFDWQPSDTHADSLASIAAWRAEAGLTNMREPVAIDAGSITWPIDSADVVLNINMAHISPWSASLGLIAGAARILPRGGPLILYGPWLKHDIETAPSNLSFDADLKARDPAWGLRKVEDFESAAAVSGFELAEFRKMPASNLMLMFRLTGKR